ncbi:hypothetical protein C2845_PM07G39740 [Panicum miliaceum]|uniref:Uncharacterized protein n=1 Tax=Panicum miliaceum TaxID=4540 RepID=A0A3L6SRY7_PANMI|nr:hypothetical protein C2845_PM07G39740 [Panicum miliaceum]
MRRLWRWYQQCLASHPVRTQVVSSGILWASGDIGAQAVTHYSARRPDRRANNTPEDKDKDKEFKVDWRRVGITSSFGFAFVGPVGHYWYEYLDRFIRRRFQPNTFKFVASKVAADGLLFGPLDLLLFFSYVGLGQGRSVEQVKEDVKRDFIPALVLGGMIWPAVQIANFRFIPVRYQLLCFLSWIEQQGDASWKQWFTSFHKIEDQKKTFAASRARLLPFPEVKNTTGARVSVGETDRPIYSARSAAATSQAAHARIE